MNRFDGYVEQPSHLPFASPICQRPLNRPAKPPTERQYRSRRFSRTNDVYYSTPIQILVNRGGIPPVPQQPVASARASRFALPLLLRQAVTFDGAGRCPTEPDSIGRFCFSVFGQCLDVPLRGSPFPSDPRKCQIVAADPYRI